MDDKILETEEYFNQFLFIVWFVNPIKDNIRVILDDGTIKLYLKRDKFLKIMSDILNETLLVECQKSLFLIKKSLEIYGGVFFYDRKNNEFRQLFEKIDLERIKPQELIHESRKSLVKESLQENFKQSQKLNETTLGQFSFQSAKKFFNNVIMSHRLKG